MTSNPTPSEDAGKLSRLLDAPYWAWCWIAYWLVIAWPHGRMDRAWMWLLPFAGVYAYHDPSCMSWRRSSRIALEKQDKPNG